jgi:hypothetical protein
LKVLTALAKALESSVIITLGVVDVSSQKFCKIFKKFSLFYDFVRANPNGTILRVEEYPQKTPTFQFC